MHFQTQTQDLLTGECKQIIAALQLKLNSVKTLANKIQTRYLLVDGEMKSVAAVCCIVIPSCSLVLSPRRLFSLPANDAQYVSVMVSSKIQRFCCYTSFYHPSPRSSQPTTALPHIFLPPFPLWLRFQCGWDDRFPAALMSRQHPKDLPSDLATNVSYTKAWGKNLAVPPLDRRGPLNQYFQEDIATNRH